MSRTQRFQFLFCAAVDIVAGLLLSPLNVVLGVIIIMFLLAEVAVNG